MYDAQGRLVLSKDELQNILIIGWANTFKEIENISEYAKLPQEIFNQVIIEYLVFYFYYIDRIILDMFGEAERDETRKDVKWRIVFALEHYDEMMLKMKNKPFELDDSVGGAFKYLSKYALAINFSDICDERLAEYHSYKFVICSRGREKYIKEGTAHLAFGKRITGLVKNKPEDPFRNKVNIMVRKYLEFYTGRLRNAGILKESTLTLEGWLFEQFCEFRETCRELFKAFFKLP